MPAVSKRRSGRFAFQQALKRRHADGSRPFIKPKDGAKHCFVNLPEPLPLVPFDDVLDEVPSRTVSVCLPYAKCWTWGDARRMFPRLSAKKYRSGALKVGDMTVDIVPGSLLDMGVLEGDWDMVFDIIDGTSQPLYDMMHFCTTIEERLGDQSEDDDYSPRTPSVGPVRVFRSFDIPHEPQLGDLEDDRLFEQDFTPDLIRLGRVDIEPSFRGLGLGKVLVNRGLELIGGKSCPVYLRPFPLQWSSVKGEGDLIQHANGQPDPLGRCKLTQAQEEQMERDTRRVTDWWKGLGFSEVEGTEYLVRAAML